MGLFRGIRKAFKKVWRGVKKTFAKVMKPVAKFLNSKLGKGLMLAISVFSMGSALLAGGKGFLAGGKGFLSKFVNGGKEFLNSLVGTSFETAGGVADAAAKTGAQGAANLAAESAVSAGEVLAGGGAGAAVEGAAQAGGTLAEGAAAAAGSALPEAAATAAEGTGSWLTKAAKAAMDFAKSDGGSNIIGGMISGAGQGAAEREQQKFDSRVERMFEDPDDPGMRALRAHDYNIDTPQGLAGRSSQLAGQTNTQTGRYTPHIPFEVPVGG